jgi:Family of unknown function (DUF6494)
MFDHIVNTNGAAMRVMERGDSILTVLSGLVTCPRGCTMNEDVFNTTIRKLLKEFGVTAQREIERAVRQAVAEHRLKGREKLPAKLTLSIPAVGLTLKIEGDVDLG